MGMTGSRWRRRWTPLSTRFGAWTTCFRTISPRANGARSTATRPRVPSRYRKQPEQFLRYLDGPRGRVAVDLAPFALGLIVRKHVVQAPNLVESGVHRRLHLEPVIPINRDRVRRAMA